MKTVIPIEFESYLVEKINSGLAPDMNEVVFAYIPDLDINEDIDRAKGLPPESTWVHKQSIDKASKLNRNTLIYSVVVPSKYTFTFNAVYLHDKNTQNSCGLVIHKLDELKEIGTTMTRSFAQQYLGAAEIADIHVTPETWQIDFSARIEGIDDDVRLNNLDHYGHTAFISGFNVEKISANEYRIREGIAYVGGLRCELKNTVTKTITAKPDGIYLDVVREGTILSWWINTPVVRTSKTPLSDYIDNSGNQHYVTRIAGIRSDGSIEDWREWNIVSQAEAEEGESSTPRKWTALRVLQAIKAWAAKNLGTAASRDVMKHALDINTLDAILFRGAFGIGGYTNNFTTISSGSFHDLKITGIYGTGSLVTDAPSDGNQFIVFVMGRSSSYTTLIAVQDTGVSASTIKCFIKHQANGVWSDWDEFLHTGNTGTAVTRNVMTSPTDLDTPDALMIRGAGGLMAPANQGGFRSYVLPWFNMGASGVHDEWLVLVQYNSQVVHGIFGEIRTSRGSSATGNTFSVEKVELQSAMGHTRATSIYNVFNRFIRFGVLNIAGTEYLALKASNSGGEAHNMLCFHGTVIGGDERLFTRVRESNDGVLVVNPDLGLVYANYHSGNLPPATESDAASTSTEVKAWSPQRIRQAIDARIPNTSEAVNSYCLCIHNQEAGISPTTGSLISASKLYRCNAAGTAVATTSGTWRLMTPISISSNNPAERVGLFVRVN